MHCVGFATRQSKALPVNSANSFNRDLLGLSKLYRETV
jgi:hypothetical protein